MRTPLRIVPVVTIEHGRRFADALLEGIAEPSTEARWEAVDATGVMSFPDDEEARDRYHEIAGEILTRAWARAWLREPLAAAFVSAANEVLDAERDEAMPPRFVTLKEHGTDSPLWINPQHVQAFYGQGSWTVIHLANGNLRTVEERPEDIAASLSAAMSAR